MSSEFFESRYYTSEDGTRLHYREYAGPPNARLTIICIPGLTRNARDFEDLAPHLALRYRVLCVDLRGRGLSENAADPMTYIPPVYVQDMVTLLESINLKHVALIGTSLGGIISMILGATIPDRVLGIVLNDVGPEISPAGLSRIGKYVGKTKPIANWDEAAAAVRLIDGEIFPDYQSHDIWLKMARRRFVEREDGSLRPNYDLDIAKPFAESPTAVNLWPFFKKLKRIPSLAIRGETSDLLSEETFVQMKYAVPKVEQVTVKDRGHAPHLDESEALTAIDEFLQSLPSELSWLTVLRRKIAAVFFMIYLKVTGVI